MNSKIIHIGGGWYHIIVTGHNMKMARGKANAIAKAEELLRTPALVTTTNVADVYLSFIKKETNQ